MVIKMDACLTPGPQGLIVIRCNTIVSIRAVIMEDDSMRSKSGVGGPAASIGFCILSVNPGRGTRGDRKVSGHQEPRRSWL